MTDTTGRRAYRSDLRREQAEATRRRIVDAARPLLLERGYAAATMAEVAAAAGVAVQTLYAACPGGKAGLAKLVYDVTLAGDARPIPQAERDEVRAIVEEPDPARKLELYAAMASGVAARIAPLYQVLRAAEAAAPADAALHDVLRRTDEEHRAGARGPAAHLSDVDALRPGLSVERAADQIFALTSVDVYARLTQLCGWTIDEYREWLAATLRANLLAGYA
ncbi:TetR family transcriptional regulator [Dactylosporangium sp. CA-233914]|uniref:TetR family transcriptional regulator n=1 Tax=Dactylosporangium sp. CA-233914 TaxID=3239934 RepID=UPI003D92BB58